MTGVFESVNINGRRFTVDAEASINYKYGGFLNEVKPNADGSFRGVKTRKVGAMSSIPLVMDDQRDDEEFIQETMDSLTFFPYSATKVDGTVLSGTGQIVEDPETDSKEGTKEVNYMGSLAKQL